MSHIVKIVGEIVLWAVALAWLSRAIAAARGLPAIPDLLLAGFDCVPQGTPTITVIVPARNEEENIAATLSSLLGQDYPVQIIAVDDRSTDSTGIIIDQLASTHPEKLLGLHVKELPDGWLGKTHAMALAARQAGTDFILFTDGDVLFRSDAIRRSLVAAIESGADHFVTVPAPITRRWDEAAVLGFFQNVSLVWGARPWRIADPKAKRDVIGIGAFNMIRKEAYLQIGGFEALRMEIVEDIGLGRRVKQAGLAQRIAFGRGLVTLYWAAGSWGLIDVMTKNLFAAMLFSVWLAMAAGFWLTIFCIAPFVGFLCEGTRLQAILTVGALLWVYRLIGRHTGISTIYALLAPYGAALMAFALLRSAYRTLRQGGITWRGTFYSLAQLKKSTAGEAN